MLKIEESTKPDRSVLWALGFRPFFLGAGIFSILVMGLWLAAYGLQLDIGLRVLEPVSWHAHEMIFGYSMAVIAGFLLTAVKNWTGVQTLHGWKLALPFLCWAGARLGPFTGSLAVMAALDIVFAAWVFAGIVHPVIRARSWKQVGIASKVLLLLAANVLFYLGAMGILEQGQRWGLYSGMYLVLALIMVMGRRVIPFFIENALAMRGRLKNWRWLDISSLLVFVIFLVVDVFTALAGVSASLALALFVLHGLRLAGWHAPGIWRHPLLWVLYVAYAAITAGFLLKAAAWFPAVSPLPAIHLFAVGGIGLMTVGMMSRVALGHTGRDVGSPPAAVAWLFLLLVVGTIFRVFLPLLAAQYYTVWVICSQLCWIAAFLAFVVIYFPILVGPRVDGQPG